MASRKTAVGRPADVPVRVRKAYFDCRFGQLHVRTAFPGSGGFDERTTLVCFHPSGRSSRIFEPALPAIAADRSVYAPDTPGCGESDPAPQPGVQEHASAICDFLEAMRFRKVDLLSCGDGAIIAGEVAKRLPAVINKRLDLPLREWEQLGAEPQALARRVREAFG